MRTRTFQHVVLHALFVEQCLSLSSHTTSTATTTTNNIPVPTGKSYLPFQIHSIECLARSPRLLLADEMGLGKTVSVIGALNVLRHSLSTILIVAPKSVLPNWQWELKQWLVDWEEWEIETITAEKGIPATDTTTSEFSLDRTIWLINYDIVDKFKTELHQISWDAIVCDEAHSLKNPNAIRTKVILGESGGRGGGRGRQKRHSIQALRWWFLSGSPMLNNPSELYTLLRHLDPHCSILPELTSYEVFAGHYSNAKQAPWGVTYRGGRNLPELRSRLTQPRPDCKTPLMIRRTKAQVLPELPPKQHQLLPLWDQDKSVAALELQLLKTALQGFENGDDKPRTKRGWEKKTVASLKDILKENNLKVSGKKQELIERLEENGIFSQEDKEEKETVSIGEEEELMSTTSSVPETILFDSAQSALRSQSQGSQSVLYDLLAELYNNSNTTKMKDGQDSIRGLFAQARHDTARQKIPHAIELIQQAIPSHKVVVFAHHRDVQQELRQILGDTITVGIMGGDSLEDRADAVRRFQTDDSVRVFVGSIRAAGTGITLNAANHVIFVELDWSPLVVQQAEDRCHRVGQVSSVLVQYLFFPDTIDEYLSQLLAAKQSTISAAIDEASGSAKLVLDFGKHKGSCVGDVAGSDPSYLEWLAKTKEMMMKRPKLAEALKDLGFLHQEVVAGEDEDSVTQEGATTSSDPSGFRSTSGSYVMTFGKHKGKSLADIPEGYLQWLQSSGAVRRYPTMASCVNKHLAEKRQMDLSSGKS